MLVLTILRLLKVGETALSERILWIGVFPSSDNAQLRIADGLKVIGRDIRAKCQFLKLLVMVLVRVLGNKGTNLTHF